jgi:hypothetical protein
MMSDIFRTEMVLMISLGTSVEKQFLYSGCWKAGGKRGQAKNRVESGDRQKIAKIANQSTIVD